VPTMSIRGHRAAGAMLSGSFSNGFNTAILGVNNIINSVSNLNIYPNPSNGQISVEWSAVGPNESLWDGQWSEVHISILNELGQVVYNNTDTQVAGKNKKQLNLKNLASGIYTLRMQTSGGTTIRKVELMKK
jgi:hypothetical protein